MQIKLKNVSSIIKQKKEFIDEDLLSSIGHFVFDTAFKEMKSFDNLIININGFYSYFYTQKRLLELKNTITVFLETGVAPLKDKVKTTFLPYTSKEDLLIMLDKINARLVDYDNYLKEKKQNRDERYPMGFQQKEI